MSCLYLDNFFNGIKNDVTTLNFIPRKPVSFETKILDAFIEHLKKKEIHLVCFDFDNTLVDSQYGKEFYNPTNVRKRITPLFHKLVELLTANNIDISIVTYNMNPVLLHAFDPFPIFQREDSRLGTGKGWHLDSAMQCFNESRHLEDTNGIRSTNVLLLDDDPMNTQIATRSGFHCINNEHVFTLKDLAMFIKNS